jgi:hypothetical protein
LKAGDTAAASGGADLMALMAGPDTSGDTVLSSSSADQGLSDYLTHQKYVLGVDDIVLLSKTGSILATTDPNLKGSFVDPDGVTFDRAKSAIYYSSVLRDQKRKTISLTLQVR